VATATDDGIDPVARGLLNRLKKIESDILFDQEEAEEKWVALRISLVKEVATRKKLGIGDESSSKPKIVNGARNPEAGPSEPVDGIAAAENEDPYIDLGDLFTGLPEYKVDDVSGVSGMVSTGSDGKLVNVRDFGKWSGISPRRVLEEACKARLVLFTVHYEVDANWSKQRFFVKGLLWRYVFLQLLLPTLTYSTLVSRSRCSCSYIGRWEYLPSR